MAVSLLKKNKNTVSKLRRDLGDIFSRKPGYRTDFRVDGLNTGIYKDEKIYPGLYFNFRGTEISDNIEAVDMKDSIYFCINLDKFTFDVSRTYEMLQGTMEGYILWIKIPDWIHGGRDINVLKSNPILKGLYDEGFLASDGKRKADSELYNTKTYKDIFSFYYDAMTSKKYSLRLVKEAFPSLKSRHLLPILVLNSDMTGWAYNDDRWTASYLSNRVKIDINNIGHKRIEARFDLVTLDQ